MTDETTQYVLKQIHHEPCEYYTFGDKLNSELRDYETLHKLGIPMPRLLEVDTQQERILKEYIAGKTVAELLKTGQMESEWLVQVQKMCARLYPAGLNIGGFSIGQCRHRKGRIKHEKFNRRKSAICMVGNYCNCSILCHLFCQDNIAEATWNTDTSDMWETMQ